MSQETILRPRRSGGAGPLVDAVGTLASTVTDAFTEFARTVTPVVSSTTRRVSHRCPRCDEPCRRRCRDSDCHCTCCVCDADVVVFTRVGERRVVPLVIENTRRRERDLKLDLSGFTTKGGGEAPVEVQLIGPAEVKLEGCAEHKTGLLIDVSMDREGKKGEDRVPDVDDCLVAVGDLRLEGCDVRPIRVAVAVLPRDCDPYEIECGCGCC